MVVEDYTQKSLGCQLSGAYSIMSRQTLMSSIPYHELTITFARSGGKGGQNVNKTSTKVIIHWSVGKSRAFSDEQKYRIRTKLVNRLNNNDEIVIAAEEERSQAQNRDQAIARLHSLVTQALKVPKKRTATKPSYSSKVKRLDSKKKHSTTKQKRRGLFW